MSKIGIGIPCLSVDIPLLEKYCLPSIKKLDPQPDITYILLNDGVKGGLKQLRRMIFEKLFRDYGCDLVLVVDSDFILFHDILKYVDRKRVTTFAHCIRYPISGLIMILYGLIITQGWTGCYCLSRDIWNNQIKDKWLGHDSDIPRLINFDYKYVRIPKYMIIRRDMKALKRNIFYHKYNLNLPFRRKIIRLLRVFPI